VNWANILTRLGSDATKAKCAASHPGFTSAECNTVEEYFGAKGLQAPFLGGVQVAALVDVTKIAEQIRQAVQALRPTTVRISALICSTVTSAHRPTSPPRRRPS
jgi:hypothetical protein